jgi:hypothetical protein
MESSQSCQKHKGKDVSWSIFLHFGFEMRPEVFWVVQLTLIGNKIGRMLVADTNNIYNGVEISFGKLQRIWWAWDQLMRAEHEEEVSGALSKGFHKTQSTGRNREV